jgi:CheY-like chemotaxis protein
MNNQILVVNRIETLRRLTVQILRNSGYQTIEEAVDLIEAEKKFRKWNSEGIILIELGGTWLKTPVFDFLENLSENPPAKKVKIVATVEVQDSINTKQLQHRGVDKVILQTFNLTQFSSELAGVLGKPQSNFTAKLV